MSDEWISRSRPAPRGLAEYAFRYRAKIDAVSPESQRSTFEAEHEECFLGVSLENSNFVRPKLFAILEWISRRFSRCTVLIGDSIHRITLETTRQLPPDVAAAEALRLGAEFREQEQHVFEGFAGRVGLSFVTCSELQQLERYTVYHAHLCSLFQEDPEFRASVERFGRNYHSKHSQSISALERERRVARSSDYFLEEFAIFACLRERGLKVMVYPGSFSTLAEIADGLYPSAPAPLRDLIVISLHMKGR